MSVYVDEMSVCLQSDKWPFAQSCHLVADSVEELQTFARKLRLHRSWFQDKSEMPHYDLTDRMRSRAILLGAIECDRKKIFELIRKNRSSKRTGQQSLLF